MTDRDLETASLKAQLDTLAAMWRQVEEEARIKANASEQARYWAGYADMAERAVQALRGLEDRW